MNPYTVLNIELTATKAEILKAFRKKAREVHPDKNKSPQAAKDFQKLIKARDILLEDSSNGTTKLKAKKAYQQPKETPKKSAEEVKKEQNLDRQATKKKSLFTKESKEIKQHRKKIKTAQQRLSGKY